MEHVNPLEAFMLRARANNVPMARICEVAKVAPTTPSRWKRGKTRPTVDTLHQLNVALDAILSRTPTDAQTERAA